MKIDDMRKLVKVNLTHTAADQGRVLEAMKDLGLDPTSFYQELEMSSRYVNTHRDVSYHHVAVNLHSHNYHEIIYCRSAAGVEYVIGAERYRLQDGDIIFVPPGISHRPLLPETLAAPYERDVLWISVSFMDTFRILFPDGNPNEKEKSMQIRTAGTRWEFLGDMFRAGVLEEERKQPGWEAAVLGNSLTLLMHIKRICMERSAGTMRAEKPELLDQILDYIEKHYSESVSLDDLARRFYVSSSTISHLFKQRMGVSVYRYITQRRLIAAKSLIQEGQTLEAVGEQAGFGDYSAFYRAFKQEFGISPREYRRIRDSAE